MACTRRQLFKPSTDDSCVLIDETVPTVIKPSLSNILIKEIASSPVVGLRRSSRFAARQSICGNELNSSVANLSNNTSSDLDIFDSSFHSINNRNEFQWIKTPGSRRVLKNRNSFRNCEKSPEALYDDKITPTPATIEKYNAVEKKELKNLPCYSKPVAASPKSESPTPNRENFISHVKPTAGNRESVKKSKGMVENERKTVKGSRRRNIEAWLECSRHVSPHTPPMELSSTTPVPDKFNRDVHPEVKAVLEAIYGDDWDVIKGKKSSTEVKRKPSNPLRRVASEVKSKPYSPKNTNGARKRIFIDGDLPSKIINKTPSLNDDLKRKRTPVRLEHQEQNLEKKRKLSSNNLMTSPQPQPSVRTFLASLSVSTTTSQSHPDAQYFKINFAKAKDELWDYLYKIYNAQVFENKLPDKMVFTWNSRIRKTAGFCYNKRKKVDGEFMRISRIELSPKVVDRADRMRDTVIHELCHAATWIVDGEVKGHGVTWQAWASKASSCFPELPKIVRCHNYDILTKFTYRCTSCGYSINRQTRSLDTDRKRCGHCRGKFELLYNKKKKGKLEAPEVNTTRTLKTPNAFAKFVKENYQTMKAENIGMKHADIMKLLSQKYAEQKMERPI